MNQDEQRQYAEGWRDIRDFLDRSTDQELIDLYKANRLQATKEQPSNQYFWGGFEHLEGVMYARHLMDELS